MFQVKIDDRVVAITDCSVKAFNILWGWQGAGYPARLFREGREVDV